LCTSESGDAIVDATTEFAMVIKTRVDQMEYAIGAELDCYDPERSGSAEDASIEAMVELKACKAAETRRNEINILRFKYARWWFQSYIAGVPAMLIGSWKPDGSLIATTKLNTLDLPSLSRQGLPAHIRDQVSRRPNCPRIYFASGVVSRPDAQLLERRNLLDDE